MTFTNVITTLKIDRLSAKNKIKLNQKQLRLSDEYLYSSEEEQEKQNKKQEKREEKQEEKQDKKPFDLDDLIELIINREKLPINNELLKKHFNLENPNFMYKALNETKDKG